MAYPKRLTARLARYYRSIMRARDGGLTWGEIREIAIAAGIVEESISAKALASGFQRAKVAIADGRLSVVQEELPGLGVQKPAQPKVGQGRQNPTVPAQAQPLPTVQAKKLPEDENERMAEFAKHGLHFR